MNGAADLKIAMIQDGARRHYVVPAVLQRVGALGCMFTDWFASPLSREAVLSRLMGFFDNETGNRMRERFHPELNKANVHRNPFMTFRLRNQRSKFDTDEAFYRYVARETGTWIRGVGFAGCNAMYGYIRNVDERVFAMAKRQGLWTVGDQIIAPAVIEDRQRTAQIERFPGWESESAQHDLSIFDEMERASWAHLDVITCGSQYVADGLISQGVEESKIRVVPYAPTGANLPFVDRAKKPVITVGFLGLVSLRKGVPFVYELAKRVACASVRFVMIGTNTLNQDRIDEMKSCIEIRPPVNRSQLAETFGEFDILIHPSTCEGCAVTVLEAMETGLSVIASPDSGTIIRDGETGFIRAYDDIDGMAHCIDQLAADASLRRSIGQSAKKQIDQLDMNWYTRELLSLFA